MCMSYQLKWEKKVRVNWEERPTLAGHDSRFLLVHRQRCLCLLSLPQPESEIKPDKIYFVKQAEKSSIIMPSEVHSVVVTTCWCCDHLWRGVGHVTSIIVHHSVHHSDNDVVIPGDHLGGWGPCHQHHSAPGIIARHNNHNGHDNGLDNWHDFQFLCQCPVLVSCRILISLHFIALT